MNVDYELLQRGCDRALEIRLMQERIRKAYPVGELGQIGYGVYICRGCA